MKETKKDKLKKYPKTKSFRVVDTISVPHPYCITAKHVCHASDNYSGMLNKDAIKNGEEQGIFCGTCKGDLSYKEHETALLVEVKTEDNKKLNKYLLSIKSLCEKDGYAGFAFIKATKEITE